MNFLYWNIHKKLSFADAIVEMIFENKIDVAMFAEFPPTFAPILECSLQVRDPNFHLIQQIQRNKVEIFSRLSQGAIVDVYDSSRLTIKRLYSPVLHSDVNLAICHFYDSYNVNEASQSEYAEDLREQIVQFETINSNSKTILCGDLNMNPFDEGVVKARGLNAVMNKAIAISGSRTIHGNDYKFFYNPMWGFLGDTGKGDVSGTYYHNPSRPIQYYWHILDQVMVRPELVKFFDADLLEIITGTEHYNLLTNNGLIDDKTYSDHLPLKFNLKI